jgi:hypothetical protein
MTSVTTKIEAAQLLTESAFQLFDDWFDPIEASGSATASGSSSK